MKYLESQLVMLNPMAPHFAQFCWNHHVYPVLKNSKNFGKECKPDLTSQKWPVPSAAIDQVALDKLAFLKDTKSALRVGLDQAK